MYAKREKKALSLGMATMKCWDWKKHFRVFLSIGKKVCWVKRWKCILAQRICKFDLLNIFIRTNRVVEEELVAQARTLRCKEDSLMRESILLLGDQSVAEPKVGMSDLQATSWIAPKLPSSLAAVVPCAAVLTAPDVPSLRQSASRRPLDSVLSLRFLNAAPPHLNKLNLSSPQKWDLRLEILMRKRWPTTT
jgi:hypothetical protein